MAARLAGASRIVAVDIDQRRLDLARDLGATDTIVSDAGIEGALREIRPDGYEFSFNTTSAPAIYETANNCLAMEGTAGFVTRPAGDWSPKVGQMLAGGRKMQGILGGSAAPQLFIPMLIDYWKQGRFPFDQLVQTFAFDEIAAAWAECHAGHAIKPVLMMEPA
jgi:aryl-alcohol dehydrogenase